MTFGLTIFFAVSVTALFCNIKSIFGPETAVISNVTQKPVSSFQAHASALNPGKTNYGLGLHRHMVLYRIILGSVGS